MKISELKCSRHLREIVFNEYPALNNRAYARLFAVLAFGTWRCEDTKNLLLPTSLLAQCEDRSNLFQSGNYQGNTLLNNFSREVAPIYSSGWNGLHRKCRTVEKIEFNKNVEQAIEAEREQFTIITERVYFVDGCPVNPKCQKFLREQLQKEALMLSNKAHCEDAAKLLKYLNSVNPNRFTKILDNMKAAQDAAWQLSDEARIKHTLNLLMAICNQPVPFYQPSPKGRTVRIFSYNESMLGLKKEIRRILTPDWVELDLRNSQASIIAKDWDIPLLQDQLNESESLWHYLLRSINIPLNTDSKKAVKTAFYSLVFGMQERGIAWNFSHALSIGGAGRQLLDLSLIQDILKARERMIQNVENDGGIADAYGKWIVLSSECNAKSALAQCAQSAEMKLLSRIINLAIEQRNKKSGFSIVLWQHDGFSIVAHKREDEDQCVKRLQDAVRAEAKQTGYITYLERS